MSALAEKKCVPCEGGVAALNRAEAEMFLKDVPGWRMSEDGKKIGIRYVMKNFTAALDLMNRIGQVAESENHHPDLHLTGYRNLAVELSTHAIGGLSENDFILAAKVNDLPKTLKT